MRPGRPFPFDGPAVTHLLVVARSDSFSQLWPQLATAAGASARVVAAPDEAAGGADALALLL